MSTTPKDIAFDNASKNRDHNIFTEEYYGGADTFIYINGKRCEDISAMSFSLRETVRPIFGYASRRFDDISVGTRIVQGMIRVPVKNEGPVDRLTDTSNEGSYRLTNKSSDITVPDWVYKYSPDKEELGSQNTDYATVDVDRATVATVQTLLAKTDDSVQINGYIDLPTKLAIANYKKNSNLVVNTNLDMDLQNRMGTIGDKYIVSSVSDIKLRYAPTEDSLSFYDIHGGNILVIQGYVGNDWLLVQVKDGKKGYIKVIEKRDHNG